MLRDIEILRKYNFHHVILDESQAIKNPLAKSAKATRLLKAEHRLVMTGTPVENNTFELWSQFAFLNPGLLGSMEYFKKEFANPIESAGDEKSAELLRKLIYPFILRRTKEQVALELPPRTERIVYTDMETAQKKFYTQTRERYRAELLGLIDHQLEVALAVVDVVRDGTDADQARSVNSRRVVDRDPEGRAVVNRLRERLDSDPRAVKEGRRLEDLDGVG
jgi:non-specific serine/threonine protein kinase